MINIEVSNVKSKITGLTQKQTELLYDKLSYEESQTIFLKLRNPKLFGIDMRKRLFQPKRGVFPSGLLERVRGILSDNAINIVDNRQTPDKTNYFVNKVEFPESRYYQKEALEIILNNLNSAIEMCTGSGKTLLIMNAVRERGVNTLIIVPTKNLLNQFLETAQYYFGSKYVGTHKDKVQKPITIANIQGLQRKDQAYFDYFQQVIIDEYHHSSSDSYYDLNKKFWNHIAYRISVSATGFRNDNSDMKLEAISGPILYKYSFRQAVEDKNIVPPHFVIYEIKHFSVPSNGWHQDYDQHLVNDKNRNNKIIEITEKFLTTTDKNILILANRIEHVEKIAKRIEGSIIVTGETSDNSKKFTDYALGKIRCMVATSQVVGEGIDLPNIDVLIIAGGYESEILISQSIGRVVRLNSEGNKRFGIVVDFYDKGQEILERHSKSRLKIFLDNFGKKFVRIVK